MPSFAPSRSHPRPVRWSWIVGSVVAIPVLIALVGYLVAPGLIRRQVEDVLTRELGRTTTVERVQVHPFSLEVRIEGLTVAGGGTPLARIEAIDVDGSIASLWHWAPVVDALRITRPQLAFARLDAQRYDISDLIDRALAPAAPDATPARYSINNIEVVDGRIAFDDRPMQRAHAFEAVRVGIPFLSSLPYDAQIKVTPALAAQVNGTPLALEGALTPFAERPEATLAVDLDRLPLAQYVDYLPFRMRYRLAGGELTTRVTIAFAQGAPAQHRLTATGMLAVDALQVTRADDAPLASVQRIEAELAPLDVGKRSLHFARVEASGARLALRRRADGSVELADPWMLEAPAAGAQRAQPAAVQPWQFSIARVRITGDDLTVEDVAVSPAYRLHANAFEASAEGLSSVTGREGKVTAVLQAQDGIRAKLDGMAVLQPFSIEGRFEVAQARLASLYPYAADALDLAIQSGQADVAGAFAFDRPGAPGLVIRDAEGVVRELALNLPNEREALWRVPRIVIGGIGVDGNAKRVRVGEVRAEQPRMRLRREPGGTVNFARMVKPAAEGATGASAWSVLLDRFVIADGRVAFSDATTRPAASFTFDDVDVVVETLSNDPGRKSNARLRARASDGARLSVDGPFTLSPFALDWKTEVRGARAVALRPYVDPHVDVVLGGGIADAAGRLRLVQKAGALAGGFSGRVEMRDVATTLASNGSDLLRWKRLAVEDVKLELEPFDFAVGDVQLSDFYARVIVQQDGTLNLQHLARGTAGARPEAPPRSAANADVPARGGRAAGPARGALARAGETTERTLRRLSDQALPFAIGRIQLQRGTVDFSDHFIRPNYNANLTQVEGSISAMTPERAGDIALDAKLDDAAPVEIRGRLQPFAREITFDLAGKATGIELPPLSTYSAKYAGYGITRGTMSFEVDYKVVDRKLEANNRLVLDQLTFGERVESPDATKLPVLLAVSLLKDANGVIDLELPLSGTLDDPQFSVFGLIVKVVVNLLTRAATAPFALLSAAAGGTGTSGPALDQVTFAAGSAAVEGGTADVLQRLAKALSARPALRLEISGHADPRTDAPALARRALEDALRTARMKEQGDAAGAPAAMPPEQRVRWLGVVYRAAPIEDRPRNAIGMLQQLPPAQMEEKLLAHFTPPPEALPALAQARAQAVHDALAAGGVDKQRMTLVAGQEGKADARQVRFALR